MLEWKAYRRGMEENANYNREFSARKFKLLLLSVMEAYFILFIFIKITNEIHHTIELMVNFFLPNVQVLLFGPRARGKFSSDSDYDLLIVTNETFAPV